MSLKNAYDLKAKAPVGAEIIQKHQSINLR